MGKIYNPFRAAGYKNLRQVLAKAGSSPIGKAIQQKAVNKIMSYKHGGPVKETGLAYVHRGEYVIPVHHHKKRRGKKHHRK